MVGSQRWRARRVSARCYARRCPSARSFRGVGGRVWVATSPPRSRGPDARQHGRRHGGHGRHALGLEPLPHAVQDVVRGVERLELPRRQRAHRVRHVGPDQPTAARTRRPASARRPPRRPAPAPRRRSPPRAAPSCARRARPPCAPSAMRQPSWGLSAAAARPMGYVLAALAFRGPRWRPERPLPVTNFTTQY